MSIQPQTSPMHYSCGLCKDALAKLTSPSPMYCWSGVREPLMSSQLTLDINPCRSLQLYLYCTVAFATARTLDFLMTPMYVPCGDRQYQWQVGAHSLIQRVTIQFADYAGAVSIIFFHVLPLSQ